MGSGIYTALSGAVANETRVDVLSHNLANANTVGFQGFKVALETAKGKVNNNELVFAGPSAIATDTTAGPIVNTGNPLDISLSSDVYMRVTQGDRQGYVRGATLVPTEDGRLLTAQGQVVLNSDGEPIAIPSGARDIQILADGTVFADGADAGRLNLVQFDNIANLKQEAGRLIVDRGNAGVRPADVPQPIMPGYLEMANVNAVKSMTDLISAQHSYSAAIKVIEQFDALEKKAASGLIG
ncbi:MAG: flagellar hook-basal body protein [Deltaproteobacteria bacterium]|nr:flagellar hook-basal body protein [Deltaproteobacteria bacterium]